MGSEMCIRDRSPNVKTKIMKRKINHQLRANDKGKITAHIKISDIFVVVMMNSLTDKLSSYVRHP